MYGLTERHCGEGGGGAADHIAGEARWANRLRKNDAMGIVLQELQVVWGDIKKMSRGWKCERGNGAVVGRQRGGIRSKAGHNQSTPRGSPIRRRMFGSISSHRSETHDWGYTCTKGSPQNEKYALSASRLGHVERTLVALGQNI